MNEKDAAVLRIISASLFPEQGRQFIHEYKNVDFDAVYCELKDQAVLSLTAGLLRDLPLRDELRQRWKTTVYQTVYNGAILSEAEKQALNTLEGINVCVMKGSASAIYYPNPEIRTFGDIDLLVHPKDFQSAMERLIAIGYRVQDPERPTGRNVQLFKGQVEVELHQSYFGGRYMKERDARDEQLFKAMSTCEHRNIGKHVFPMFDDANNGMILLHHLHRHILDGVGLRHLIDWMMFVNQVCNDDYWHSTFHAISEQLDLVVFAKAITRTCQLYLGLPQTITWCQDVDESYCETFITYLLQKGNFGKKSKPTGEEMVLSKLSMRKGIGEEWKQLQKRGAVNWPLAQKHPVLAKVAWIRQIGIYVMKLIRMKALRQVISQRRKAAERNRMFRAFNVIK